MNLFPYFGGKATVAHLVWAALGDCAAYTEPFAGSAAVFLARPADLPPLRNAVLNDADGYVANLWRAIARDPEGVARWAEWPRIEADLHARVRWCKERRESLTERLRRDPEWYSVKAAGWWIWGQSASIPGNWPRFDGARPNIRRQGVLLDDGLARVAACHERIKDVVVLCGDWRRAVASDSVLFLPWLGTGQTTGVFMDPPYGAAATRDAGCYACDSLAVADDVRRWCMERGADPRLRIVLAGYDGEHNDLDAAGWRVVAWQPNGGMANRAQGRGRKNKGRERLWLSPHCLPVHADGPRAAGRGDLFGVLRG